MTYSQSPRRSFFLQTCVFFYVICKTPNTRKRYENKLQYYFTYKCCKRSSHSLPVGRAGFGHRLLLIPTLLQRCPHPACGLLRVPEQPANHSPRFHAIVTQFQNTPALPCVATSIYTVYTHIHIDGLWLLHTHSSSHDPRYEKTRSWRRLRDEVPQERLRKQ